MALVLTAAIIVVAHLAGYLAMTVGLVKWVNVTNTVNPDGGTTVTMQFPFQSVSLVQYSVGIPLLLLTASRLNTSPLDALALRLPKRLGWALLIVIALVALEYVLRYASAELLTAFTPHVSPGLRDAVTREGLVLSILTTAILGPLAEELVFRGMLLQSLAKTRLGFWGAAVLVAVPFALIHGQQYGVLNSFSIVLTGLLFALGLRLTGSLWAPIVQHMALNSVAVALLHFRA
jgi:membrane protease YdiL (CAAX protease family)